LIYFFFCVLLSLASLSLSFFDRSALSLFFFSLQIPLPQAASSLALVLCHGWAGFTPLLSFFFPLRVLSSGRSLSACFLAASVAAAWLMPFPPFASGTLLLYRQLANGSVLACAFRNSDKFTIPCMRGKDKFTIPCMRVLVR
jgi:hypothetical protein